MHSFGRFGCVACGENTYLDKYIHHCYDGDAGVAGGSLLFARIGSTSKLGCTGF